MAKQTRQLSDAVVVATFARWAGDAPNTRDLLILATSLSRKDHASTRSRRGHKEAILPAVVQKIAADRARLMEASRGGQEEAPEALAANESLTESPLSPYLQGNSLRGVYRPVGPREYELRAYLTNLAVEKRFFKRAREAASRYEHTSMVQPEGAVLSARAGTALKADRLLQWVMPRPVLRIITIDTFALVLVRGFWTDELPPVHTRPIVESFKEVMRLLDEPAGPRSRV